MTSATRDVCCEEAAPAVGNRGESEKAVGHGGPIASLPDMERAEEGPGDGSVERAVGA